MTMRWVGYILGLVALIVAIAIIARQRQHVLEAGLPLRISCANQSDALVRAGSAAILVLGTGSMAPYIPASAAGLDPLKTVTAYAVLGTKPFSDIKVGDLVVYRAAWAGGQYVIHQAASLDSTGWIMSGLHNARSESWARVTAAEFAGVVARVYTWPATATL